MWLFEFLDLQSVSRLNNHLLSLRHDPLIGPDDLMIIDSIACAISGASSFDLVERPDYFELLHEWLVLGDRRQRGRVMLLVAHDDVRDQRALTRQEGARRLQRHCMPHLTVRLREGLTLPRR